MKSLQIKIDYHIGRSQWGLVEFQICDRNSSEMTTVTPHKAWSDVDVFDFEDHRQYLSAIIENRKQKRRGFSLRQFTRRVGFKSPGTLSMIISGQRSLTMNSAQKIAEGLALKGRRRKYFMAIARHGIAKIETDKSQIKNEMMFLKSQVDQSYLDAKKYRFLAEWYYPVIYVLIGKNDFTEDADWIAKRLGRGITAKQVEKALKDIKDLKLVERDEKGKLKQTSVSLSTKDDVISSAMLQYHQQMMELAKEAFNLPAKKREFGAITVEVPEDKLPFVKRKLRAFRTDLNEYLSQFSGEGEVFQINMNIFPLTFDLDDKKMETPES